MHFAPELIIVIPSFNEESLIETLSSLKNSSVKDIPTEVLLVFNAPEDASKTIKNRNEQAFKECQNWSKKNSDDSFHVISRLYNDLNPKTSGVGMARKIGMDEAADRFKQLDKNGVIVALDADCTVKENYIKEVYNHFLRNTKIQASNICFEHRFEDDDDKVNEAAIQYELHLRYFRQAQIFIGFPFSYHTVGSSMAVRSEIYTKSRGMNTRKAGEDFYFLQKLFSQYAFGELNSTTVYPLGRLSDRVPFGTGAALNKWDKSGRNHMSTYQFSAFLEIKNFLDEIQTLSSNEAWSNYLNQKDHSTLHDFLEQENFYESFKKVVLNSNKIEVILNQFFRWFNNFKLLKCLNYLRDTNYPMESVLIESGKLLDSIGFERPASSLDMLALFRNLDKLNLNKT